MRLGDPTASRSVKKRTKKLIQTSVLNRFQNETTRFGVFLRTPYLRALTKLFTQSQKTKKTNPNIFE